MCREINAGFLFDHYSKFILLMPKTVTAGQEVTVLVSLAGPSTTPAVTVKVDIQSEKSQTIAAVEKSLTISTYTVKPVFNEPLRSVDFVG